MINEILKTPLKEIRYAIIDVETTRRPFTNTLTVIELGAVIMNGFKITKESFNTLVNPACAIKDLDIRVTGITNEMVKDSPFIDDILPEFMRFIDSAVLIAHNASFDEKVLRQSCEGTGTEWRPVLVIDTLKMARKVLQEKGYSLPKLKNDLGIVTESHRALGDCLAVAQLFVILAKKFISEYRFTTIGQLVNYLNSRKDESTGQMELF